MPAPTSRRDYAVGIALVVAATIGWSLAGFFVRLVPTLSGWQINGGRGLVMAVVILAWLLISYGARLPAVYRAIPPLAFVIFATQFTLGSTLYATALTLAPTANVSCIGATSPVMTAILAALVIGERARAATFICAGLALAGVAFIVRDGLEAGNWLGNLAALGGAFCWAVQAVMLRGYRDVDLVPALVVAGLMTFILAGLFGDGFDIPADAMLPLAMMGVLQLAIPVILFARGARHVPAVTASLILLLDAVLNPFWTFIGVGEIPPSAALLGGALILTAVSLTILSGQRASVPA